MDTHVNNSRMLRMNYTFSVLATIARLALCITVNLYL